MAQGEGLCGKAVGQLQVKRAGYTFRNFQDQAGEIVEFSEGPTAMETFRSGPLSTLPRAAQSSRRT